MAFLPLCHQKSGNIQTTQVKAVIPLLARDRGSSSLSVIFNSTQVFNWFYPFLFHSITFSYSFPPIVSKHLMNTSVILFAFYPKLCISLNNKSPILCTDEGHHRKHPVNSCLRWNWKCKNVTKREAEELVV